MTLMIKLVATYIILVGCCWVMIKTSPHDWKSKSIYFSEYPRYVEALQRSELHNAILDINFPEHTELTLRKTDGELELWFSTLREDRAPVIERIKESCSSQNLALSYTNDDYLFVWKIPGSAEAVSKQVESIATEVFSINASEQINITYYHLGKIRK